MHPYPVLYLMVLFCGDPCFYYMLVACHKLSNAMFFLYADDPCLVFHHRDITQTEKQLDEDFFDINGNKVVFKA